MRNNLLLINRHAPYGTSIAKAALDVALVCAAYEQNICILFRDDGVYQLLHDQHAEKIQQKSFSSLLASLEYYEINDIYVHQESLSMRQINIENLMIPSLKLIDNTQLAQLLAKQKHILSF